MSFFKKEETGLFIAENGGPVSTSSPYFEKDSIAEDDTDRFNELETPSKRRRLSEEKDAAQDQEEDELAQGDECKRHREDEFTYKYRVQLARKDHRELESEEEG